MSHDADDPIGRKIAEMKRPGQHSPRVAPGAARRPEMRTKDPTQTSVPVNFRGDGLDTHTAAAMNIQHGASHRSMLSGDARATVMNIKFNDLLAGAISVDKETQVTSHLDLWMSSKDGKWVLNQNSNYMLGWTVTMLVFTTYTAASTPFEVALLEVRCIIASLPSASHTFRVSPASHTRPANPAPFSVAGRNLGPDVVVHPLR